MARFRLLSVGLLVLLALLVAAGTWADSLPAVPENADFGLLHRAPGIVETYIACIPCHSERLIVQQGLTREAWQETLQNMVEEHGMGEIEEPHLGIILDYLATHYNQDRPHYPYRHDSSP